MNNKGISILTLVAVIAGLVFYFYFDGFTPSENLNQDQVEQGAPNGSLKKQQSVKQTTVEKDVKNNGDASNNASLNAEITSDQRSVCDLVKGYDDWHPEGDNYTSMALMRQSNQWAFARGYYNTAYGDSRSSYNNANDYSYQSTDNLKVMAQSGDAEANARLVYRLTNSEQLSTIEAAQPYCRQALIDGYTASIQCLTAPLANKLITTLQAATNDPQYLQQLQTQYEAWKIVALELGDPLAKQVMGWAVEKHMTEVDVEKAQNLAQQMVTEIKKERQEQEVQEKVYPELPELAAYMFHAGNESYEKINDCFK